MWNKIIGQSRVKNILKNIYTSNKLSHAYIFFGKEGVGKDATALEFAKLVNCENKASLNEACDKCHSCKQIMLFSSPYVKFITALPAGKSGSDSEDNPLLKLSNEDYKAYLDEIKIKSVDLYHKINLNGANNIRIDSIRFLKKEIYLTVDQGKMKVFIISNCDLMNLESANSLLKILEEPPKNSILILTTSKVNALLPTILGRCQKIKFDDINTNDIKNYITTNYSDIKKDEVEIFANLSEGSISKCKEILTDDFIEYRESVLSLLAALLTHSNLSQSFELEKITSKKDKTKLKNYLKILLLIIRDFQIHENGNVDLILNRDKILRIQKFTSRFKANYYNIVLLIEECIKNIDSNLNSEILLYNLCSNIRINISSKF